MTQGNVPLDLYGCNGDVRCVGLSTRQQQAAHIHAQLSLISLFHHLHSLHCSSHSFPSLSSLPALPLPIHCCSFLLMVLLLPPFHASILPPLLPALSSLLALCPNSMSKVIFL